MTPGNTSEERPATAAAVCTACELGSEARALLGQDIAPEEFLNQLEAQGMNRDAVRFLAHTLTKREAVWWGCLCVWHMARAAEPAPEANDALRAAVRWVRSGSEEDRKAAELPGRVAGIASPAGALALAAFWSGGSMSHRDLPQVAPGPYLTARTVAAAIQSAVRIKPDHFRVFLELGRGVLQGTNLWQDRPS